MIRIKRAKSGDEAKKIADWCFKKEKFYRKKVDDLQI